MYVPVKTVNTEIAMCRSGEEDSGSVSRLHDLKRAGGNVRMSLLFRHVDKTRWMRLSAV